jgi:hypothetical protein
MDLETDDPVAGNEFDPDDLMPTGESIGCAPSLPLSHHSTPAGQYQALVAARLAEQELLTPIDRISQRLDLGAFQTACRQIQAQANALNLPDVSEILNSFKSWLFTREVPDEPTNSDVHWREAHALGPPWTGLARIGLRYCSIGTSEADVERVIGEQRQIQGSFGGNFGTETLHARLVLRHQHPSSET